MWLSTRIKSSVVFVSCKALCDVALAHLSSLMLGVFLSFIVLQQREHLLVS